MPVVRQKKSVVQTESPITALQVTSATQTCAAGARGACCPASGRRPAPRARWPAATCACASGSTSASPWACPTSPAGAASSWCAALPYMCWGTTPTPVHTEL